MILITGKHGQLASSLAELFTIRNVKFKSFSKEEWDISNYKDCEKNLVGDCSIVINTAAYTKVDLAETHTDLADQINHLGVENLATICQKKNSKLIHISTDFLFHGYPSEKSDCSFWSPTDPPSAIGSYANSKFLGERKLHELMEPSQFHIIRTSWLYSYFNSNFVYSILKILSQPEKKEINVIEDQIGRPTYSGRLAEFILLLIEKIQGIKEIPNILHFSNLGVASWYDFSVSIQEFALEMGYLKTKKKIHPIPTVKYPTPAVRPKHSILNLEKTLEILPSIPHWREDLRLCMSNPLFKQKL
jgi:dTDP-4-dehydrorhamnose reductase